MILGRNRAFAGIISQDEVILDWVALNPVAAVIIGIRRVDTHKAGGHVTVRQR